MTHLHCSIYLAEKYSKKIMFFFVNSIKLTKAFALIASLFVQVMCQCLCQCSKSLEVCVTEAQ